MPRTATILTQNTDYTIDFSLANDEYRLNVSCQVWDGDPNNEPGGLNASVVIEDGDSTDDLRDKIIAEFMQHEDQWIIPNNTPIYWTLPDRTRT